MTDLPPPNKLTRGELYRRIWETPLIRVAAEFGVTNFLLSALCQRHDIPTPPAGYWSKLAHGKPTSRPLLAGDHNQLLTIAGLQRPGFRASKPTSRVERRAKSAALTPVDATPTTPAAHPKLHKTFARLEAEVSAERIAEKIALTDLMNDDAVIASWVDVETGGYRRS